MAGTNPNPDRGRAKRSCAQKQVASHGSKALNSATLEDLTQRPKQAAKDRNGTCQACVKNPPHDIRKLQRLIVEAGWILNLIGDSCYGS